MSKHVKTFSCLAAALAVTLSIPMTAVPADAKTGRTYARPASVAIAVRKAPRPAKAPMFSAHKRRSHATEGGDVFYAVCNKLGAGASTQPEGHAECTNMNGTVVLDTKDD